MKTKQERRKALKSRNVRDECKARLNDAVTFALREAGWFRLLIEVMNVNPT